jgi:hypothetical protein
MARLVYILDADMLLFGEKCLSMKVPSLASQNFNGAYCTSYDSMLR